MNKIQYSLASSSWDDKEITAMNEVIGSGFFSMGEKVAEFEKQFADFFGSRYAVMVNSGSSANLLMVASLFYKKGNPLQRGDEVIVPAVSWSTTYSPLAQYGLKLKFVDIDLDTLNFDLDSLREAISDKTRLIMAVNLLGNANDYMRINELTEGKDILLIEDNCESMGATFMGQQLGTYGLMGSFSTFFSHHISTMEGGVIISDDEELYHILLCLRAHGWTRNLPENNLVSGQKSEELFEESFRFVLPGYNLRPTELQGAIATEQLKKLPAFIEQRRVNAEYFFSLFQNHDQLQLQKEIGCSSWFGFSLVIRRESDWKRSELVKVLAENHIDCRPIVAGNFAKNEVLKWFDYEIHRELKNAEHIDSHGLFVGNQQCDIRPQMDHLWQVLQNFKND